MEPFIEDAAVALADSFKQNGCYRVPNPKRQKRDGLTYKKGYEVRLSAGSVAELRRLRALLQQVGLAPGKPYRKRRRIIQPVYGRDAVERFRELVGSVGR